MLLGGFLASNSLLDLGGQKKLCSWYVTTQRILNKTPNFLQYSYLSVKKMNMYPRRKLQIKLCIISRIFCQFFSLCKLTNNWCRIIIFVQKKMAIITIISNDHRLQLPALGDARTARPGRIIFMVFALSRARGRAPALCQITGGSTGNRSTLAWPHLWRTQLHSQPNADFCPRNLTSFLWFDLRSLDHESTKITKSWFSKFQFSMLKTSLIIFIFFC